jgi:hypothetical protein
MNMDIEAIKAKNLSVMKEVTANLKEKASKPAAPKPTVKLTDIVAKVNKEFKANNPNLVKTVTRMAKETIAKTKSTGPKAPSKQAVSVRLYDEAKLTDRDAFVKALQVEFPELSDFNARCYFNKVRNK